MATVARDWAHRARDATVGDVPRAVAPTCYPRADLFARLPMHVLSDEILGGMRPTTAKVLLALLSFVGKNGTTYPSRETLARRSSLSLATVSRAINQLVELGAIIRHRGGGRRSTKYRVCREHASQEGTAPSPVPFATAVKVDGRVNGDTAEIAPATPQPSHQRHGSSVTGETRTRSIELEPLKSSSKSQKPAAAASRVWLPEQSPEVRQKQALLSSAGVGNPTRDRIARTPEISVEDIRKHVNLARQRDKGPGVIVENLKVVWTEKRQASKRRAVALVKASARPITPAVDYDEVFAHLSHQQRRDLAREVYPGLSPEERADVDQRNWMNVPQSSVTMCRAMHRTLLERASGAPAGSPCPEPPCDAAPAVGVLQGAQHVDAPVQGAQSTTSEPLGSEPAENRVSESKALNVDGVSALGGPPPGGEGPAAPERGEVADGGRDPPDAPPPGGGGSESLAVPSGDRVGALLFSVREF